ncbi:hypothetical protein PG993_013537 [Apiospora rasikravindrae]|uniref:Uncharacterized protein n=1 Tax=Apiospora rasikravindrae TaxID=990691 RepID=A0ABR1RXX7_9PEZI
MSMTPQLTRERNRLSFEDIAGEYRIFILFENLTSPVEVVYHKAKDVLYVLDKRGDNPSSQKIEVVSTLEEPVEPMDSIKIAPYSKPYGFELYGEACDLMAYVPGGRIWINTDSRAVQWFETDPPSPHYAAPTYGNFVEKVDLETGQITWRIDVPYFITPVDEMSGLLKFNFSNNANRFDKVTPSPHPLIANAQTDPITRRLRDTFLTNKIYIMPKQVIMV